LKDTTAIGSALNLLLFNPSGNLLASEEAPAERCDEDQFDE
jgi:hypothetical protein